jgi:D-alanyl-D-alanine carboxypeptidase/D-alanyl-D-alanine-endopeptidase (penicillin-binding protein 4)
MKYLISTTSLMLLLLWPIQAQETNNASEDHVSVTERISTTAETKYLTKLALKGFRLDAQGLLIESVDGSTIYADHQSNIAFNPASVIKLATSFTALQKFGPDYRFETAFYAAGDIDKKTRTLKGDLILQATGDPVLTTADVNKLIRDVTKAGIARVDGNLVVCGPFTFASYSKTADGTKHLASVVKKMGIRVSGTTSFRAVSGLGMRGNMLSSHSSAYLRDILFTQNAHSINLTAERVGEAVGGPKGVEAFLTGSVGIPQAEISISRTSGLDYNRITPRSTVHLLQVMMQWMSQRNMEPEDIMPVAGIDAGTLQSRFKSADYRGAVVGKTGTLPSTDGGVSTLAGILYTRDRGPILFAIFNTRGSVKAYRQLQDSLLQELIAESGGPQTIRRASN